MPIKTQNYTRLIDEFAQKVNPELMMVVIKGGVYGDALVVRADGNSPATVDQLSELMRMALTGSVEIVRSIEAEDQQAKLNKN